MPCNKRYHRTKYYANKLRCLTCHRQYAKRYRETHVTETLIHTRVWRNNNRRHFNDLAQSYWRWTKAFIWSLKSNPCMDCKTWFAPWQMQFDHLPGFKKKLAINAAWSGNDTTLFTELSKCQLVCSNCHENRTYLRRVN